MNTRKPYDEENETEKAWFWVVFSQMGGGRSDIKEIARLLRLGQSIPKMAQNFLADLIDPPRGGGEDVRLVLKPNDRQQKLKTELEKFQKVVRIVAAMNRGKGVTKAIAEVHVLDLPGLGPTEDIVDWAARGATPEQAPPKFPLIAWQNIAFSLFAEWLVKRLLPRKGVALFYGVSGSGKTFILLDILIHIALGWDWGGRKVKQGPVIFIAAEAAQGLKKRKVGWTKAHKDDSPGGLPGGVPFYLIEVAPNLGTGQDDLNALIAHIEAEGIRPAAIAIDTVSQTLYGADENGAGMANFISNAHALSNHFDCLVAPVHHVGLADGKRPRGYSGLVPAVDASNLCESSEDKLLSTMEVMKLKEEESKQKFSVHFARVVIGKDEDGEEVSTLFVQSVETGAVGCGKPPQQKSIPRTQRLLISIVAQALGEDETAKIIRPFNDGPLVKAVSDEAVRRRYYARIAEKAKEGEDPQKLADRQRQAFYTAVKDALKATILMACEQDETRFLWLP